MDEPTITLHCIRKNGRHDTTTLTHHTLPLAREVSKWLLHAGNGLYTTIDICTEEGYIETLQNTVIPAPVATPEVLLVEDNAGDAFLVGQALAECQIPVHLHIARDGEQAMHILGDSDFKPDLVILDLNIPTVSGFTVLASYPMKQSPVVVFTASENQADANRAIKLGAFECIHKPMDLNEYKTAVCEMVQKWAAPKENDPVSP
jgi:chemotaxis family two-component system response regulator Rcp1